MKLKFDELEAAPVKENVIPLNGKPHKSADGSKAIVEYLNFKNDPLAVAVTAEELAEMEFSKDMRYFKKPDFLKWTTGKKGAYLVHVENGNSAPATVDW